MNLSKKITTLVYGLLLLWYTSVSLSESYPKHLEIAISEVGINKKQNEKYIIDNYLKPLGINKYANYCAAFVVYCLDNANNVVNYKRSAVAQHHINKNSIKAGDVLDRKETIPLGSLVIWKYIGSWKGHIGIVLKDWFGAKGYTVEGNTSNNSTREGGNVEIKERVINRHGSFRITHFTILEYKNEYAEMVYSVRKFAFNLGIYPNWLQFKTD